MKRSIVRSRSPLAVIAASLLGASTLFLAPTSAQAHNELVSSTPSDGATLTEAPAEVSLEFNDDVQQEGGAITVTGLDGARYDVNNTFAASGTKATVDVRDIAESGRFSVTYRVVGGDGHVVQGGYTFRLKGVSDSASPSPSASDPSPTTVTPSTAPAAQDEDGGAVIWVLGLGAIGIALIAAMVAVFVRRGRG